MNSNEKIPVKFVYLTGIKREVFRNVHLTGSWDPNGRYSDQWAPVPMQQIRGEDGCPAFTATMDFDASQAGRHFSWGVKLDTPDRRDLWGIATEVNDHRSHKRERTFQLQPARNTIQEERYYLINCRHLGAQKYFKEGQNNPGIRFSVWAPNAQNVEALMGTFWDSWDPSRTPADGPFPKGRISGGYIADNGTGSHPSRGPFPMERQPDGIWVTENNSPDLADFTIFDHKPYMFRVTKDNGRVAYRTDLYSRCQIGWGNTNPEGRPYFEKTETLDGSVSCSVVIDPDTVTREFSEPVWPEENFIPEDEFWQDEFRPDRPVPRRVEDLVIYELHVGALGFGTAKPGTLQDAVELLDYLQALGVNAIELLPMAEFAGDENWGYATSHHFAVEFSGGGRDQYKWFVRECHRRGIAVIVDVVYNHFIHQAERAEWAYDSDDHEKNIYYWYEGHPFQYHEYEEKANNLSDPDRPPSGHGGYVDNVSTAYAPRYWEEIVRKMFISSAAALVEEFHVDGFRVDQTTSIHAYNVRHADGVQVPNANIFGQKLLREWSRSLKLLRPDIMLIAEDHSEWPAVTQPTDSLGLGFDAVWFANFYHHLIGDTDKGSDYAKLLKVAGLGNDEPLAMDYFAGALDASKTKRIVYHESHDEAGNGKFTHRTIAVAVNGAPLFGETRLYAEARCRLVCGITMLSAGTPMFLFGEEVGAEKDFFYNQILQNRENLHLMRRESGNRLFRFYRDIIQLRLSHPGLRSRYVDILHVHNSNRVLAFRRRGDNEEFLIMASFNNHPFPTGYTISHSQLPAGPWKEIFNSDAQAYGGNNLGNLGGVIGSENGRFEAVLPANGVVVFVKQ